MPKMGEGFLDILYVANGAGHYAKVPVLTTTQRDALTGVEGMIIFNSTTDQLEEYDGSTWQAVGQVILDTHTADIDAHMSDLFQTLLVGMYHTSLFAAIAEPATTLTLVADRLTAVPFPVVRRTTWSKIAVTVDTSEAAKSIRMGIYADNGACYPGALVLDAGAVSIASTGLRTITFTAAQQLTKGLYWLAFISDSSVAKINNAQYHLSILGYGNSTRYRSGYYYLAGTYGALPATFPAGAASTTNLPLIGLYLDSLD
jgi:hypothetical protein